MSRFSKSTPSQLPKKVVRRKNPQQIAEEEVRAAIELAQQQKNSQVLSANSQRYLAIARASKDRTLLPQLTRLIALNRTGRPRR